MEVFGRTVARRLLVCTGPCCDNGGQASAQLADLRAFLRRRGLDDEKNIGSASCVRRSCLGKCNNVPLAHVMPDDIWYRILTSENLIQIYEEHALNGRPVADLIFQED